jgi:hypothetical protein
MAGRPGALRGQRSLRDVQSPSGQGPRWSLKENFQTGHREAQGEADHPHEVGASRAGSPRGSAHSFPENRPARR